MSDFGLTQEEVGQIKDEYSDEFNYLDNLREPGLCNMFESPQWIAREYGHDRGTCRKIFKAWAQSFGERSGQ